MQKLLDYVVGIFVIAISLPSVAFFMMIQLYFSGLNAETGDSLLNSLTVETIIVLLITRIILVPFWNLLRWISYKIFRKGFKVKGKDGKVEIKE